MQSSLPTARDLQVCPRSIADKIDNFPRGLHRQISVTQYRQYCKLFCR